MCPVRSAFTENSAMLRSGRGATLGREGMPAGKPGKQVRTEKRGQQPRAGPFAVKAHLFCGIPTHGRELQGTHPRWPAAAPPPGPHPRPASSSSSRGRRPTGAGWERHQAGLAEPADAQQALRACRRKKACSAERPAGGAILRFPPVGPSFPQEPHHAAVDLDEARAAAGVLALNVEHALGDGGAGTGARVCTDEKQ
jgi:hypothetical protein